MDIEWGELHDEGLLTTRTDGAPGGRYGKGLI